MDKQAKDRESCRSMEFTVVAPDTEHDNGMLRISGIASRSTTTDDHGTRISFTQESLTDFKDNPIMFFNHNESHPIGKWDLIEQRGADLYVEGLVNKEARLPSGENIADLIRIGVIKGLSVRFRHKGSERKSDHVQLNATQLVEVSVVTLPSNKDSLFGVRAMDLDKGYGHTINMRGLQKRGLNTLSFADLQCRLADELNEAYGEGDQYFSYVNILCVYSDYTVFYAERTYYKQSYMVDDSGEVQLVGEAIEVLPQWQDVVTNVTDVEGVSMPSMPTRSKEKTIEALRNVVPEKETPTQPSYMEQFLQELTHNAR
jgi:HK97 family phage prohead protease